MKNNFSFLNTCRSDSPTLNDFSGYVTSDGERIINLPSIVCDEEFKRDLKNILLVLGKEKEEYKLDYYLYVRCNDKNKKLISLLASDHYMGSIIDNGAKKKGCISKEEELELQQYIIGLMKLDKLFKYKGFSIMHSTKFDSTNLLRAPDFKEVGCIDEYINNVCKILHECVKYINKEKLYIEFIEFKKSSLLMITKVNNSSNRGGSPVKPGGLKLSASINHHQKKSYHTSRIIHRVSYFPDYRFFTLAFERKSAILPLLSLITNHKHFYGTKSLSLRNTLTSAASSSSSSDISVKSDLNKFYESLSSLSKNNQHLYNTRNIQDASQVLIKMYESLSDSNPVKLYLKNNGLHLLSLEEGIINEETFQSNFENYRVDSVDKQGHPSLYKGKSGCYAFVCLDTGFHYVGSAVCFHTRYKAHKVNSVRPKRGGDNDLYLSVRKLG